MEQSNDEFTSLVGGMFGVMVFFLFLTGGLSLLWFIIGLKMKKTDPNNEIEKIYPSYWHLITAIILIGCAIFQLYMVYGD